MQALRTRRKRTPDQGVNRGNEFTLGSTGLCSEGCEHIWGRRSGSHRPGKAAPQRGMSHGATGEMPKVFRTRRPGEQEPNRNEGSEGRDRAGETLVSLPVKGEGLTSFEVFKESLLCFAENRQAGVRKEG